MPVRVPFNVSFIVSCIPPVLARITRCRPSHESPPTKQPRVVRLKSIPKRSRRSRPIEQLKPAGRGRRQYSFSDMTVSSDRINENNLYCILFSSIEATLLCKIATSVGHVTITVSINLQKKHYSFH